MDPRHPEQAISRMRDLMEQYNRIEQDMLKSASSAELAELEREGSLVIQEICLVAPRIHEAMMQTSRQRRHDLSRGVLDEPQDVVVEKPVEEPAEEPVEDLTFEQKHIKYTLELDKEIEAKEKAKTKKNTKKKATKKTIKKTTKKKADK